MSDVKLTYLHDLLEAAELRPWPQVPIVLGEAEHKALICMDYVQEAYESLGGQAPHSEIRLQPWGLQVDDRFVELDDAMHFNRYRRVTLRASLYQDWADFPLNNYRRFVQQHEQDCLKAASHASAWTSREAEMHFGPASDSGDLYGHGAPAWKLLAMQDLLKDAWAHRNGLKLVRLPVYENLLVAGKMCSVRQILMSRQTGMEPYLLAFMQRKLGLPVSVPQKKEDVDDVELGGDASESLG